MKIKSLFKTLALATFIFVAGCSKDNEERGDFAAEVKTGSEVDAITDDVSNIIEDQYNAQSGAGKSATTILAYLPDCATVNTTVTGNTWQRTVNFGTTGCALSNGNVLKGIITISGTNDFNAATQTVDYSFENFYHNDRLIEGNRHVVRIPENANGNRQSTITLDMQVTYPGGTVITREGTRIRELIAGADTTTLIDNQYSVTGTWVTTFPTATQNTIVTNPLIVKLSCAHIVQGTLQITRNSNELEFDYGSGACDNQATLIINGGQAITISLGN